MSFVSYLVLIMLGILGQSLYSVKKTEIDDFVLRTINKVPTVGS